MNRGKIRNLFIVVFLGLYVLAVTVVGTYGRDVEKDSNRYNVIIVVDSSGSMKTTDPDGHRFEAIRQFTNLLAETGNYLGGVVFSTDVKAQQELIPINSQEDKERVVSSLESIPAKGYTNIGDGLMAAIESLEMNGNPDLPSVIVLFSDGKTEMPEDQPERLQEALDKKADAIQLAREKDIPIYSICLNADESFATTSEMEQIATATGGDYSEVVDSEDLGDVFNSFYSLIYGTSTITLVDETYPSSGIVEKQFEVPGIGVEEVNIIIYGNTGNLALYKPTGEESKATASKLGNLTMIKVRDVVPGTWRIVTSGIPGDQIKINMVYNTNLGVKAEVEGDEDTFDTDTAITVTASLYSNNQAASNSSQYNGYTATLEVYDAYGDPVITLPMTVVGDCFKVTHTFDEGVYNFRAKVTGSFFEKESDTVGPIRVVLPEKVEEVKEVPNTPPVPVETPITKKVYIFPTRPQTLEIDMSTLATDAEDTELKYKIVTSSFLPDDDYTVEDDIITMEHYSLSKGSFDIKAIDSGGLSCKIEIIVITRNVGLMALIGLGAIALIVLICIGIGLYVALNKPFYGTIKAQSYCNGVYTGEQKKKPRGRIKLSFFRMNPTGLDYNKSYFQATGDNYIYLITNKPVSYAGKESKKIRIPSGVEMSVTVNLEQNKTITIRFDSDKPQGTRRGGRSGGGRPSGRPGAGPSGRPGTRPSGRPGAGPSGRPGTRPSGRPGTPPVRR